MRALSVLFLLLAVLMSPFIWTSLAIDQRGITISGAVSSKRESVRVRNNDWSRSSEVTIRYEVPETSSAGFTTVTMPPEEYDSYHVGQRVPLHYLRSKDVPDFPTSRLLREMHLLPTVRLADKRAFSLLDQRVPAKWLLIAGIILATILALVLWRMVWRSTFWWPMGGVIMAALTFFLFSEFPRPTQEPVGDLQQAEGRIQDVTHITRLLQSQRSQGLETKQPIDVVEVEFTPVDSHDPVLAVDLIDTNSVDGLKEGSIVRVAYERQSPRTAQIVGAKRDFYRLNFQGAFEQGMANLAVLVTAAVLCVLLPWLWKRRRRAQI